MFDKILISETTKEEREEIVKEVIAMATVGCPKPPQKYIDSYNQYTDGKKELSEVGEELYNSIFEELI